MSSWNGDSARFAVPKGNDLVDPELDWLDRRRDILARAIAEMEQHQRSPYLSQTLVPDVPGMLIWAREELRRVDGCIAERIGLAPRGRLHAPFGG